MCPPTRQIGQTDFNNQVRFLGRVLNRIWECAYDLSVGKRQVGISVDRWGLILPVLLNGELAFEKNLSKDILFYKEIFHF